MTKFSPPNIHASTDPWSKRLLNHISRTIVVKVTGVNSDDIYKS